jgi:hypothetical protein
MNGHLLPMQINGASESPSRRREIRLLIECLREQMADLEDMNVEQQSLGILTSIYDAKRGVILVYVKLKQQHYENY